MIFQLADRLALLWDELEASTEGGRSIFQRNMPRRWDEDEETRDEIAVIASVVRNAVKDGTVEQALQSTFDEASCRELGLYACVLGIDRAFALAHPFASAAGGPILDSLRDEYAYRGRYDSGVQGGAVLPRFTAPDLSAADLERLDHACANVIRVSEEHWRQLEHCGHAFATCDFSAEKRRNGVAVGCVPMVDEFDQLEFEVTNGGRGYRIAARDGTDARRRVGEAVSELSALGCDIAVMPESTLTDDLVAQWQQGLVGCRDETPRWVLAGTGPVATSAPELDPTALPTPPNRAVVLSGLDGRPLLTQDKRFRFSMDRETREQYQLAEETRLPGGETQQEDISLGAKTKIVETSLGRLAVLICEDLARPEEAGVALFRSGVSLILTPIFSKEILRHRWEERAASWFERAANATVVVSNVSVIALHRVEAGLIAKGEGGRIGWGTCFCSRPEPAIAQAPSVTEPYIWQVRVSAGPIPTAPK